MALSRSPHGERGLKSKIRPINPMDSPSLPPRGAWIEMQLILTMFCTCWSLPPRGAWIEIIGDYLGFPTKIVAPPTGSVD